MKIITVCLTAMAILTCSCRRIVDNSHSRSPDETVKRQDEIRKIMRKSRIHNLETNAHWLTAAERDQLRRMKKDYYAEVRDRDSHPTLVIPGRGWEIRGPLTVEQVKEELLELHKESSRIREKVYGPTKRFEDSDAGAHWGPFQNMYREGDEIYFFRSDERSWLNLSGEQGYVLIRKNEMLYSLVTAIN